MTLEADLADPGTFLDPDGVFISDGSDPGTFLPAMVAVIPETIEWV